MPRFSPGDRLGAYELIAPIGRGGMGEVWRALDPALRRHVAIKVLPEEALAIPIACAASRRRRRPPAC